MTSRIVQYAATKCQSDERFAMIFSLKMTGPLNEAATNLFRTATNPTCTNTPYQIWKFDSKAIPVQDNIVHHVYGKVIIVREKIVDGRWQLVSM